MHGYAVYQIAADTPGESIAPNLEERCPKPVNSIESCNKPKPIPDKREQEFQPGIPQVLLITLISQS